MEKDFNPQEFPVGIVGLGLMGSSIAACMLMAGHPVVGIELVEGALEMGDNRIRKHFILARERGLIDKDPSDYLQHLLTSANLEDLAGCKLVIESIREDKQIKGELFKKIDAVVGKDTLITSNTSAIPISELQGFVSHPDRFFGLHWMEPAYTTRFLEVICGKDSDLSKGEFLYELGALWDKETVLVKKDLPGFIANRLMYAMYREAMYLVEGDYASIEDVDRACRNVAGYCLPMMGVFRWMDFTGLSSYREVMKDLFPTLNNADAPGKLINDIVDAGGKGINNGHGFYQYTKEEKEVLEELFTQFSYEIRELALKYPGDMIQKKLEEKKREGNS